MKKLLLLISLTGALFANEIVAQKEASKFLDALKKMDYKVVNSMIEKNKKIVLNSLDYHILYFRDIKINDVKQLNEFGHYLVTLDNKDLII